MKIVTKFKEMFGEMNTKQDFLMEYSLRKTEIERVQSGFEQYRNLHKGQSMAVVATGPSLNDYQPIPGVISIGVNKAYRKKDLNFQYYFVQDYAAVKDYVEELEGVDCTKFVGQYVQERYISTVQVPESIREKIGGYPYFTLWPMDKMLPDISVEPFMNCGSVTFAAIQFALFAGAEKIYLIGCDTSKSGYFDNTKQKNVDITMDTEKLIRNYERLKTYADTYFPHSKIISVNPVGLKGVFEDLYQ